MLPNVNFNFASKNKFNSMPPVNSRLQEINHRINTIEGKNETTSLSFSEILPNAPEGQPVKLLSPSIMVDLIKTNGRKYGVDPKLINAVIKHESNYNLNAVSRSGAVGLMQLMPDTARSLGVSDIKDPAQNVEAGAKYLGQLMNKYNGNTILALAAYNAGPGAVDNFGSVPPYKETQNYVQKVLGTYLSNTASV